MPDIVKVQQVFQFGFPGGAQLSHTPSALGSTPGAGNLLTAFAILTNDNGSRVVTPPAGWTALVLGTNASDYTVLIHYRIAGASEPTSWTWTWTVAAGVMCTGIIEWTNNDTGSPIDVAEGALTDYGGANSPTTIASLTTVTDRAMLVTFGGSRLDASYTLSTGTEELDDSGMGIYSEVRATAGASGTASLTHSAFQSVTTSFRFAIRPAGGGGPVDQPYQPWQGRGPQMAH